MNRAPFAVIAAFCGTSLWPLLALSEPPLVPKVSFQVQLTAAAGLPVDEWEFDVVPEGTTPDAAQRVTSSATGLLTFDVPLSHFPPPPAVQAVEFWRGRYVPRGPRAEKLFAEYFVERERVGSVGGPFAAGESVSRVLELEAGAIAAGTVLGSGAREPLSFFYKDTTDSTDSRFWKGKFGAQRVTGLPRRAGVSLLLRNSSSRRLVSVDLSSGSGDWGTIDVPAPSGSSKLRLRLSGVPAERRSATATIVSISTGVAYHSYNSDRSGVLKGYPEDPSGISFPPGEYLIFVGALDETGLIDVLTRLRAGVAIDPTKVPRVTLVDGQITDLELSYAEWWPKQLEAIPVPPDQLFDRAGNERIDRRKKYFFPPGFKDPYAPVPSPTPAANP